MIGIDSKEYIEIKVYIDIEVIDYQYSSLIFPARVEKVLRSLTLATLTSLSYSNFSFQTISVWTLKLSHNIFMLQYMKEIHKASLYSSQHQTWSN